MRVVLATEGSRGDVFPMLDLAGALDAHGHSALVCAPPDFAADASARGVEFIAIGAAARPLLEANADAVTRGGLHAVRVAGEWFHQSCIQQFAALPEAARGADLLVAAGVQIAAASVAEHLGIPYRYVVYCPALFPSAEHPPPVIPLGTSPRLLNRVGWLLFRWLSNALVRKTVNRERKALGLTPVRDSIQHLLGPQAIVAAEPALAPVPPDYRGGARQVGCLHTPEPAPLPAKLDAFLEAGPPPVYLGFGSMTDPDPSATTRLLLEGIERAGARAVISEGWARLGDVALPENVYVTGPCSHPELFPRCATIVHHGGAGTTTAAARAGVPQIVVPHLADQFFWGGRVQRLGLGPTPIRRTRLTAQRLAAALAETLENEILGERAADLGARLAGSRPLANDPTRWLL